VFFLSDNGGCAESVPVSTDLRQFVDVLQIARRETRDGRPIRLGNDPAIPPGGEDTYQSYGRGWSNLSNTPFRLHKRWIHEGGISTPLIVHWPGGIAARNDIRHTPGQLPDLMATLVEICGGRYPERYAGEAIPPCEGTSLAPSFAGDVERAAPLFWEHIGNAGIREGRWKLVRDYPGPWELYDIVADRTETRNLADAQPDRVLAMAEKYEAWARRCGVIPFERIELVRFTATDSGTQKVG
jgi:arylsulfatase